MKNPPSVLRHSTGNQFAEDTITYTQSDTAIELHVCCKSIGTNISKHKFLVGVNALTVNIYISNQVRYDVGLYTVR